ncbi:MAG TPA: hypothetical protein VFW07_27985 [Parafilimonas sp.]|nr:hypothetical protein [Parafilimonas sp.]
MIQLLISAFLLSIVHAAVPNHWLPLLAIGRVENWSRSLTLKATVISGFAHIASTILIGLLVGWAGLKFATHYHSLFKIIAPAVLIGLGIIYLLLHLLKHREHHHDHEGKQINKTSITSIIISVSIGMFFSPCIELESYYFKAGEFGWVGILSVSAIYLLVTVSMMVLLVRLGMNQIAKLDFKLLERNERLIIGVILILTGIAALFI